MSSDQDKKNEDEWLNQLRGGSSPNDDKNDLPDWLRILNLSQSSLWRKMSISLNG